MTKDELIEKIEQCQKIEGTKSSPLTRSAVVIEVLLQYVNECDVDQAVDRFLYQEQYE